MILTVLKTTFKKREPKVRIYRSYKNFDEMTFKSDLKNKLDQIHHSANSFSELEKSFLEVFEKHAPLKKSILRANEVPYMTKALRKAIANRSRLENRYYREKTNVSLIAFKKQKNFCSRLYKSERKILYKFGSQKYY